MQFVMNMLQRRMRHRVDRYGSVLAALEEAFSSYEARQISINGYLDAVCAIDQRFRSERPTWLHLCDWSLALRWINGTERRAFRETCDALDWCRNWAIRQRGVDVASCLESARANVELGFAPALGAAA
jgi:hypothetical protein